MVLPLHRLSRFSVLCVRCSVGVFPLSLGQNSLHGVTADVQHLAFITSSQLALQSLVLHMHNTSIDQGSSGNPNRNFWFLARKQPLYLSALPWKPGGIQANEVPTGKSWEKENTLFFFSFIFISWRLITLQYCSGFSHTLTWISHGFTCVPHPDPLSHLPLHLIPRSSQCTRSEHLSHASNLGWWSVSL